MEKTMPKISDIQMRDPFMVPDGENWYLFGSTDRDIWRAPGVGFDVYRSRRKPNEDFPPDEYEGPFPAFRPPAGFYSETNFWAPEVHRYRGAWYMFATFKPVTGRRGTAVLKSNSVDGPYTPWSEGPVTPPQWECLDGTFYTDSREQPWMIFCHEWTQTGDGEICALPLTPDLKAAAGEARLLFRASETPWASPLKVKDPGRYPAPEPFYVTDGPFLYTAKNGSLLLLWSSFGVAGNYCIGVASSVSSDLRGPWKQSDACLFEADGGHGMVFSTPAGRLFLTVHSPNKSPMERPVFLEIFEKDGMLYR